MGSHSSFSLSLSLHIGNELAQPIRRDADQPTSTWLCLHFADSALRLTWCSRCASSNTRPRRPRYVLDMCEVWSQVTDPRARTHRKSADSHSLRNQGRPTDAIVC